jgi:hypothetical protein
LPGLALDETKPFECFAGIVDGVTEAHFRYDHEAAERMMGLEQPPRRTHSMRGVRLAEAA